MGHVPWSRSLSRDEQMGSTQHPFLDCRKITSSTRIQYSYHTKTIQAHSGASECHSQEQDLHEDFEDVSFADAGRLELASSLAPFRFALSLPHVKTELLARHSEWRPRPSGRCS